MPRKPDEFGMFTLFAAATTALVVSGSGDSTRSLGTGSHTDFPQFWGYFSPNMDIFLICSDMCSICSILSNICVIRMKRVIWCAPQIGKNDMH